MLNCKYASAKSAFLLPLTLLLTVLLLSLISNLNEPSSMFSNGSNWETRETRKCNIFSGNWVYYPKEPYYNNETCPFILDQLNCFKAGRSDREFLKFRWTPNDCELPLFDATQFLNMVRGKSMAFVGDSIARNQLESLLCLINTVARPEDITTKHISNNDIFFRWWFVTDYNFTIAKMWSPFLVNFHDSDPTGRGFYSSTKLYLDKEDTTWTSKIKDFDYVIFSAGQWFLRPLTFYENGQVVGCQKCENTTELNYYGYRKAFQTAFRTLINIQEFKGLTFMVTHSPGHFENGAWNEGGTCNRTKPFTNEERGAYEYRDILEALYQVQVQEFDAAKKEARKKGLRFVLIDITDVMTIRPDGHPGSYRSVMDNNLKVNDCVHWCLPGPVDTWNEFLFYAIKFQVE